VARVSRIRFHDPPENVNPSWLQRLRTPITGIGPGWKLFLCTNAPLLFRQMPQKFRFEKVRTILGPAPGWFVKQDIVGKVPLNLGVEITRAEVAAGKIRLEVTASDGSQRVLSADHVIAATGYRVDLRRLGFMDSDMQTKLSAVEHTPVLSPNFESSIPGLYFVGTSAANTFGPLLRFAYGAAFTARRLSKHLAKSATRKLQRIDAESNVATVGV